MLQNKKFTRKETNSFNEARYNLDSDNMVCIDTLKETETFTFQTVYFKEN